MVLKMKVYKTLPDGTQIVEYDDSMAQAVADMWNKSGDGWGGTFDSGIYTAERVISKRANGVFFNVYIALKDGEALGYCSFNRYYKDADTAYVHLLNVRPDHHGKGLGKELVLMCVNETIARGMPRLDIHTWPGNTKAVPMYKKCGYFWEDRSDTTHLSNFIPTVLATDLVKDYFKKADWYADSTRVIEIKPDGNKVNKFELYEYQWEKDGESLKVGFEKTGRRINLVETDDYRIEMTAEHHDLAFGLDYSCKYHVKNKTGKDLNVTINAKDNDVIDFKGSWTENVTDEATFDGTFYVNAITEAQDDMRMHPCVLADVTINGRYAEFGLGIEPKFPVTVSLGRKLRAVKPGMHETIYVNIKNALASDSTVRFKLPQNPMMQFDQSEYEVKMTKGKDASVAVNATLTGYGYDEALLSCEITTDTGNNIELTRPLHIVNQGLTGQFRFDLEDSRCAANGLWRLKLNKKNNELWFSRIVDSGFVYSQVSQLGKPYDDEFNLMKPADIRVTTEETFIKVETDFVSGKFPGAIMTEIFEFNSAGTFYRRCRVTNKGTGDLVLSVKVSLWTDIGKRPVFHYDGEIHEIADKMDYGFDTLEKDKEMENWVFDASGDSHSGIYWPAHLKPDIKWGDFFDFEYSTGVLSPEQSFETESIVYMADVFRNYKDFRNYVLDLSDDRQALPHNHTETIVNNGNPVISSDTIELTVKNNRHNIRDGIITVSSPDGLFSEENQTNCDEELCPENTFKLPIKSGETSISFADFYFRLSGHEKNIRHVLLMPDKTEIKTQEQNGIYAVENNNLCFKLSPEFSDAVYSMKYGENEWFFSKYPVHEPYAWWNPFIGGIKTQLQRMGNTFVLREKITAAFTSETDNFGNSWTGIRSDIMIENFEEYKGIHLSQYYLTLPGVPVLCHYTKIENNTGRYMDIEPSTMLLLSGKDTQSEVRAEMKEGSIVCKVRPGSIDDEFRYDRLVIIAREGETPRPEKLFVFKDSERDNGQSLIGIDDLITYCSLSMKKSVPSGGSYTTMPVFCILSEKNLTLESLDDLRRIEF